MHSGDVSQRACNCPASCAHTNCCVFQWQNAADLESGLNAFCTFAAWAIPSELYACVGANMSHDFFRTTGDELDEFQTAHDSGLTPLEVSFSHGFCA